MRIRTFIHVQGEEKIEVIKNEYSKCYCVNLGEQGDTMLFLHDDNAKRLVMALVEEMTRGIE